MYFPLGWPRVLDLCPEASTGEEEDGGGPGARDDPDWFAVRKVACNRDKIFFAILTEQALAIWFTKPCLPIVVHRRTAESVEDLGTNELVEWRPDSSTLVVVTSGGYLLYYSLRIDVNCGSLYEQRDSTHPNLRRESAELFIKENIPPLILELVLEVEVAGGATSLVCIRDELMVATTRGHILRYLWDGTLNRDYCLDLQRVPFCIDQQVAKAVPIEDSSVYVVDIEYSPLVGGFAIVLSDGRAAFLTASSLKFDPNQVQGIWAQGIEDATCAAMNHKFRLVTFGRANSQGIVYCIDETTGALHMSHQLVLSGKDYPGCPGPVSQMRWTPDGCTLAVAWAKGGLSLWSTFGTLLTCTLGWDYGRQVDLSKANPIVVYGMDWSAEGYQLWMVARQVGCETDAEITNCEDMPRVVMQLHFVKSALTVNPCVSHLEYLHLQGEDRLYINMSDPMSKIHQEDKDSPGTNAEALDTSSELPVTAGIYVGSKQWIVVPIPHVYSGTNWPIRYTAVDPGGHHVAVAGRTGVAHCSLGSRKWKLFGNESQEKDFVVMGGLLWWEDYLVLGCYNMAEGRDELRLYPRDSKLDNSCMQKCNIMSQALLLNLFRDKLLVFFANSYITVFHLHRDADSSVNSVQVVSLQSIDISALFVHPACVVSVTLTCLRPESTRAGTAGRDSSSAESVILNICGRLMMIQQDLTHVESEEDGASNGGMPHYVTPTVLASCVENVWVPDNRCREKPHLTEALWLYCGAHGMRVWLPLFPREGDKTHTFMSKRIMLPFHLRIYPLAILFKNAIIVGAENDTVLFSADANTPATLPFCVLERTSEVYLHQILRQLIRRNLGFHAWEIARSCTNLPYFPHSLELLLHEVLEEEATSKEPIPDALLPSVIEFIQEFPVYLQTVVQCARKTEIALWSYLFTAAGKPKDLFLECLKRKKLNTAASYLIILQNLEPSSISRQYATMLLDAALDGCKWDLAKDLVRFLRAIDPKDVESPRTSFVFPSKYGPTPPTPPVSPNEEDLSLLLGTMQVQRVRSFSTSTVPKPSLVDPSHRGTDGSRVSGGASVDSKPAPIPVRKKSVPGMSSSGLGLPGQVCQVNNSVSDDYEDGVPLSPSPEWFLDGLLQRHARRLLSQCRLRDLGTFAAHLDFHLVGWLQKERHSAAMLTDSVAMIKRLHADFMWPYPILTHPVSYYLQRKPSSSGSSSRSNPVSPTIEDRMRLLTIDVSGVSSLSQSNSRIGDSGYISHPGPGIGISGAPAAIGGNGGSEMDIQAMEARLMPHPEHGAENGSLVSEESNSFWGETERDPVISEANSLTDLVTSQELEQVSMEMANRGLPKAEVQLRYLLQMFMESGCLEWALVVSILLRDAMAVIRTINAARSPDQPSDVVLRLREGLLALASWSDTECLGYKPFMLAMRTQVSVLAKLLPQKVMSPLRLPSIAGTQTGPSPSPTSSIANNTGGGLLETVKDRHYHHHHTVPKCDEEDRGAGKKADGEALSHAGKEVGSAVGAGGGEVVDGEDTDAAAGSCAVS